MQSELVRAFAGAGGSEPAVGAGPLQFRNVISSAPRAVEREPAKAVAAAPSVDLSKVVQAAREEGRREAIATMHEEMERCVRTEREHVSSALDAFVAEKRRYFAGLEKEVVRLALAIAERVLHRETAMDPTLLAGTARVVLEQVDQESTATLVVAPEDAMQWHAAIATLGREVLVREEPSLERGQCLLQTEAGSFELGLRSQLCEMSVAFLSCSAAARPAPLRPACCFSPM